MLRIDGSLGEGGGQVLRTALSLSLVTSTPFVLERIRARRPRPGLMRQHLTAVLAAAEVGGAEVSGAELGGQQITFRPGRVQPGEHAFAVGTAGSAILVLQTVLPALLLAGRPSHVSLAGGTHNPLAPPYEFFERAYLPRLREMGARVSATLRRPGFYPAGGGQLEVAVEPPLTGVLTPIELLERGNVLRRRARAVVARLPRSVAQRELQVVADELGWSEGERQAEEVQASGPGNYLCLEIACRRTDEVFSAIGERGKPAETVARQAVAEAQRWLAADVAVGEHLADQLLLPLALARGGAFSTVAPSLHTRTQLELIPQFLDVELRAQPVAGDAWRIEVVR